MNQPWTRFLPDFIRRRIEGRQYLQDVISNTGWQFADNILRMGVGLFVGVWVARYLGPERYGLLSYALAFVALFIPLATLGMDDIVVRDIVRESANKDEILGTAFVLRIVGSTVSVFVTVVAVLILRPADILSHWLVGITAIGCMACPVNIIECWFNSQLRSRYIVLARSSAFLLSSAAKIGLIVTGASLIAFAVVGVAEIGIAALGLISAYALQGERLIKWRCSLEMAKALLRDSWPLAFSIIAIVFYQRIDQVMLQQLVGSKEVGIYSVAVRLVEVWAFIPSAIYWSFYPSILEAKGDSSSLLDERVQKFYNLMAFSAYVVAILITLFGPWLAGIMFGPSYAGAGPILIVLGWANLFTTLEIARAAFLNAVDLNRIYFVVVIAGALLNVILNWFLIPCYGGMGAAVASLISYWFAAHGSCFLCNRLFKTGIMLTKAIVYPKIW